MFLNKTNKYSRGFTLIEILVALVIGLIATVVMFQVLSASEAQRRATTGEGDVQSVANIALVNIQNQINQSGYGFSSSEAVNIIGCSLEIPLEDSGVRVLPQIAPVIINPSFIASGDASTDTILVAYGAGVGSQHGSKIMTVENEGFGLHYGLGSTETFRDHDFVVAVSETLRGDCLDKPLILGEVAIPSDGVDAKEKASIRVSKGATDVVDGVVYNFGPLPGREGVSSEQTAHIRAYRVKNQVLEECDFLLSSCADDSPGWKTIASDIVSLRAQYRWFDENHQLIFNQDTPTGVNSYRDFAQIIGVRFALVARNGQPSKEVVTTTDNQPSWAGQEDVPIVWDTVSDADRYRYKTFETFAPIRNVIWMGS